MARSIQLTDPVTGEILHPETSVGQIAGFNGVETDKTLNNENVPADAKAVGEQLATKQDILVSGTNLKTVNGTSLLGSGNIEIQGGSASYEKFVVVGVWGQSNAVGYDEGLLTKLDIPYSPNRIFQVSAIDGNIKPLTYCAENLQNMNTVEARNAGEKTNMRNQRANESAARQQYVMTKGIHLPLANLICSVIPDDYGVIIVPYAYGGQNIDYFLARVNNFAANIKKALDTHVDSIFAGIIWCQGEYDITRLTGDQYKAKFIDLVNNTNAQLASYASHSFKGSIDVHDWYFFEFPQYFRNSNGPAIMAGMKEVLGEDNYIEVPEDHPVNTTLYTSSVAAAHFAGDYFRTYIAPHVFAKMQANNVFLTSVKNTVVVNTEGGGSTPSEPIEIEGLEDLVQTAVQKEMSINSEGMVAVNESDYTHLGGNNEFVINNGAITLRTTNTGMFEFNDNISEFEFKITSAQNGGLMLLVGKTSDGKYIEMYLGSTTGFAEFFTKASSDVTAWTDVLTMNSGTTRKGNGQYENSNVKSWAKTTIVGSTIKVTIDWGMGVHTFYKDGQFIGTLEIGSIFTETITPIIGFGAYWSGSNSIVMEGIKIPGGTSTTLKEVVTDLNTTVTHINTRLEAMYENFGKPFVPSTSADDIVEWYNLQLKPTTSEYLSASGSSSTHVALVANSDNFKWAFIGNFVDGFKLYNKATQTYLTAAASDSAATMTAEGSIFTLAPTTASGYGYPKFCLKTVYNGNTVYVNSLQNSVTGYYTGTDVGSTITAVPAIYA